MTHPVVFISYSHKDEEEKEQLLAHLGVLRDVVDLWSEDRIAPGSDWSGEIQETMRQASVAVLLITANFLTSDFILGEEVPTLLQRREQEGLVVIPVIARACAWRAVDWLARMNVRPRNGRPVWSDVGSHTDEDLATIAEEIAGIVSRPSPYPAYPSPAPPNAPSGSPAVPSRQRSAAASWLLAGLGLTIAILILAGLSWRLWPHLSSNGRTSPTEPAIIPTGLLTPVATFTATPESSGQPSTGPHFTEIVFARDFDPTRREPIGSDTCFVEGITEIHAVFRYEGLSASDYWRRVWYLNGSEIQPSEPKPWERQSEGVLDISFSNNGQPLPPGDWRLELYVDNALLQVGYFSIRTAC